MTPKKRTRYIALSHYEGAAVIVCIVGLLLIIALTISVPDQKALPKIAPTIDYPIVLLEEPTTKPVAQRASSRMKLVPETEPVIESVAAPAYTEAELLALAQTLAGECYENQTQDKLNVAWVVCNRVSDGRFGGSDIISVLSCKSPAVQFVGYWKQARAISDNDMEIAREVLTAWYAGIPAPHGYLYFSSGKGAVNHFR